VLDKAVNRLPLKLDRLSLFHLSVPRACDEPSYMGLDEYNCFQNAFVEPLCEPSANTGVDQGNCCSLSKVLSLLHESAHMSLNQDHRIFPLFRISYALKWAIFCGTGYCFYQFRYRLCKVSLRSWLCGWLWWICYGLSGEPTSWPLGRWWSTWLRDWNLNLFYRRQLARWSLFWDMRYWSRR
jgi:hypothetical protein